MALKKMFVPERLDIVIAVLIALVSLTTALAAWRTNVVGSSAADAKDASGDEMYHATAKNLRQYLLPNLQLLSEPLGTQEKYLKSDGSFDIEKRFADLEADAPDLLALDPAASFKLADQYSSEQRWLTIGTVLFAIGLFWLGMAEILAGRARVINLFIGLGIYLFGIVFMIIIEAVAL